MYKHINRIGIELEGGWNDCPSGIKEDGSVDVSANYTGEIVSRPLINFKTWVNTNYPQYVNRSCGLHVHVSLKNTELYSRLMSKNFYDNLMIRLNKKGKELLSTNPFHTLFDRLQGKNEYCRATYCPDSQARQHSKSGVRYSQINYCYSLHGTIEFRVLPMFSNAETANEFIKVIVSYIEEYLDMPDTFKEEDTIKAFEDETDYITRIEV